MKYNNYYRPRKQDPTTYSKQASGMCKQHLGLGDKSKILYESQPIQAEFRS